MADERTPEQMSPGAPVLLFPQEEAVVDARGLRLVWEKVDEATAYYVEVSADPEFNAIVFEKNVGDVNNIALEEVLPGDDSTFYWRVFAGNEHGWSHGENIESFISAEGEHLKEQYASPDIDEEFGPAARLFRGAAVEMAADVSDSEAVQRAEAELGVAHEGVEAKQIMGFVLAVAIALIVIVVIMFTYASVVTQEARRSVGARSQYFELNETRRAAEEQLMNYEVIDEEAGRYRIPIDRAMELMVQESQNGGSTAGLTAPGSE